MPAIDIAKINAAMGDGVFTPTPGMQVTTQNGITVARIGHGAQTVIMTGDSLMFQYGPRVQQLLAENRLAKTVYFVVGPSCSPIPGITRTGLFGNCAAMPRITAQLVAAHPGAAIVLGEFWAGNDAADTFITRNGKTQPVTSQAARDAVLANLTDAMRALTASGHPVSLILAQPSGGHFDPAHMISRTPLGFRVDPVSVAGTPTAAIAATLAPLNARLAAAASAAGAATLDPLPAICGAGPVCSPFFDDGAPKFADDKHLRPAFMRRHVTLLDGLLTGKQP
jgi:hypothetical protein